MPSLRAARLAAIALPLAAVPALAQVAPATPIPAAPTAAAEAAPAPPPPTAPPFAQAIQEGLARIRESNFAGAQIVFQRAISLDRDRPEGHYYLGICQRHQSSFPHAVESFHHAIQKAQHANEPRWEGAARFALADTLAGMGHSHATQAHTAFNELLAFAESHPDVVAPEIPRSYLQAQQRVVDLDATMDPVRHRIRQRAAEAARGHR